MARVGEKESSMYFVHKSDFPNAESLSYPTGVEPPKASSLWFDGEDCYFLCEHAGRPLAPVGSSLCLSPSREIWAAHVLLFPTSLRVMQVTPYLYPGYREHAVFAVRLG